MCQEVTWYLHFRKKGNGYPAIHGLNLSSISFRLEPDFLLSLRRQVLHDQLLLNLPRAGRQQGYVVVAVRCE
jgi:hypothetical protein